MADRVRVVHDEQGRLVALKAPPPDDPDRTRREAALLGTVEHPGVVRVLGLDEEKGVAELRTAWVGSRRATDLGRPLAPARAAGLVVAVAAIVADLHRLGVVHGTIEAAHVLLDPYGRPVLCGFGAATRIGTGIGPGPGDGEGALPSTDVAGLGRLLRQLLTRPDPDEEPDALPGPGAPSRRDDRRTAARRRALLALARRAEAGDPSARPGLRAFVDAVRDAVPEAALGPTDRPDRPDPAPDPLTALLADAEPATTTAALDGVPIDATPGAAGEDAAAGPATPPTTPLEPLGDVVIDAPRVGPVPEPDPLRAGGGPSPEGAAQLFRDLARLRPEPAAPRAARRGGLVGAAAAVVVLGAVSFMGVSALAGGPAPEPGAAEPGMGAPADAPTTTRAPSSSRPTTTPTTGALATAATSPTSPPPSPPPTTTVTAAAEAPVVEHDGRRFAVGRPGDVAVVGDWSCDGRPRAALLRLTSGAVFVFPTWPDAGAAHEVHPVTAVPGATGLVVEPRSDGCPQLRVTGGGPSVTIDPELLR